MKRLIALAAILLLLPLTSFAETAGDDTILLSFIGDCTLGGQYIYRGYEYGFVNQMKDRMDYPFSGAADLFAEDDLTIANCEVCFTDRKPADKEKAMSLSAPPSYAKIFRYGNVDVVNTVNNHSQDFGDKGYMDTIAALDAYGIASFGGEYLYETVIKGVKIGFVGKTYPISDRSIKQYKEQVEQLKADGCTFIIASVHWGREMCYDLNEAQRKYATKLLDLGIDMIYGHGPHVLQPIQYINGKVILYSTANFSFGANSQPEDDDTAVFQLTFRINEDKTVSVASLQAIPYKMHNKKDFRPYRIEDEAGCLKVWKKLYSNLKYLDSNLPESFKTTGYVDFTAY